MAKTKIVVLKKKHMIYTGIFFCLGLLIIVFLGVLFWPGKSGVDLSFGNDSEAIYEAGIYTKEIELGDACINLQVSLDEDHINSVELVNLEESVETMYPLMKGAVEKISEQLSAGKNMEEIVVSEEAQYTEKMLVASIAEMIDEHRK